MRIGVVSDTHGQVDQTRPAIRMLESLEVERVLHCGDIGSPEVVELFAPWPTHFVFGNCDYDHALLANAMEDGGQHCHGTFGDLEFSGVRIALLHSHERQKFREAIDNPEYDIVCYGHTHIAACDEQEGKIVLNPGALYRANQHSIALLELPECVATIVEL